MRELTELEAQAVVGGGIIADYAAEGGAIGTVVGYLGETTIMGATRGGLAGAMLGTAYGGGYMVGTFLWNSYQDS